MKITAQEEYGIRCLLQVAIQTQNSPLASLENIAAAEKLSTDYAAKLLMVLRKANLVESVRGKLGGYKLSKPPEKIYLDEVVRALSGELFEEETCNHFSGDHDGCVHINSCSVRSVWASISHILFRMLEQINLKNLLDNEDILTKYIKKEIVLSI